MEEVKFIKSFDILIVKKSKCKSFEFLTSIVAKYVKLFNIKKRRST